MGRPRTVRPILLLCALTTGCGGATALAPDSHDSTASDSGTVTSDALDDDATGDTGPVCPAAALLPDGGCCAPGQIFNPEQAACRAIGPAACAFGDGPSVLDAPDACHPGWCVDDSGAAAACTVEQLSSGQACPAGQWPDPVESGACTPSGAPASDGWRWTDEDETVAPRRCSQIEAEPEGCCLPGEWPDPLRAGACTPAGLPPGCDAPESCPITDHDWGWRSDAATGHALCDPVEPGCCRPGEQPGADGDTCTEIGLPAAWCPPGFLFDTDHCVPDPAECGDGPYGDIDPGATAVFVDAAAGASGNGTQGAPFNTLAEGLAAAPSGGVVALAAGTYAASVSLTSPVSIIGRCAHDVVLMAGGGKAVVEVTQFIVGEPPLLRDVTLSGPGPAAWLVGGGSLVAERVYVSDVHEGGFLLNHGDSELTLRESVIGNIEPLDGAAAGVGVFLGAHATLESVRMDHGGDGLVAAQQGSGFDADTVLIAHPDSEPPGFEEAVGVVIVEGGVASANNLTIRGKRQLGVLIFNFGQLAAHGLAIEGIVEQDALQVHGGSKLDISGLLVRDVGRYGLFGLEAGTRLSLAGARFDVSPGGAAPGDVQAIRVGNDAELDLLSGRVSGGAAVGLTLGGADADLSGVTVDDGGRWGTIEPRAMEIVGGSVRLTASRLAGGFDTGILVSEPTDARLRGVSIDNGGPAAGSGAGTECVAAQLGAVVDVRGSHLRGAGTVGSTVFSPDTVGRFAGVLVSGTGPFIGQGLATAQGAHLEATAVTIADVLDRGVFVNQQASATLEGVLIRSVLAGPGDRGFGVEVDDGTLSWLAGEVRDATHAGVMVWGAGTTLDARGVTVTDTIGSLSQPRLGAGLDVRAGAVATWSGSVLEGNNEVNVTASGAGTTLALSGLHLIAAQGEPGTSFGGGVSISDGAELSANACLIDAHTTFGVRLHHAVGSLIDTVVRATAALGSDPGGDGLIAQDSDLELTRCVSTGAQRAGVLLNASTGTAADSVIGLNAYGIVLQGSSWAAEGSEVFEHPEGDTVEDASLALPADPLERPELR